YRFLPIDPFKTLLGWDMDGITNEGWVEEQRGEGESVLAFLKRKRGVLISFDFAVLILQLIN
ncbi:MAG: hypothetical protein J6T33_01825, partial [Bacteroidales bacterium]|nr:hypothetical protein [Bacteroidales bacterium]